MSELPQGWTTVSIGEICDLKNGKAFKTHEWEESGVPIVRIQNLNNRDSKYNYYNGDVDERHRLFGGELLFAWSGTPGTSFGAHIWRGGDAVLNQHIYRVDFSEDCLHKRFLMFAINQKLQELIDTAHGGVGLRHVTKKKFEATEILLPPFDEQKRIADKLDAVLARVDACREKLERVPAILTQFRQSVLQAATTGELTKDWREGRGLEMDWEEVELGDVAISFDYGTSAKSQKEGKMPVLRMGNIQDGVLDWSDLVFTSDKNEAEKYALESGDVLFNRTNSPQLVGKTAVYKGERPAIHAGYLIRVKCGERLIPDYLNYCLNSPAGKDYCWQVKSDGVSQSNINAKKLAAFYFLLPSNEEQDFIVGRVEDLFQRLKEYQELYDLLMSAVTGLTATILAKAFRGELVAQDPGDEPAEELLKRIAVTKDSSERRSQRTRTKQKRNVQLEEEERLLMAITSVKELVDLMEKGTLIDPEQLYRRADVTIDQFYELLKEATGKELIREERSGDFEQHVHLVRVL